MRATGGLELDSDPAVRESFHSAHPAVEEDLDAVLAEDLRDRGSDVHVLAREQLPAALDDGDTAAEAPHRLGELDADVAIRASSMA
jgi:hypothetical protein